MAGGVSSGVTGLYRSPLEGYSTGRSGGLALGLGRGLLGAVGLPLSGALDLVSSVSSSIASTAGVSHNPQRKRAGLKLGRWTILKQALKVSWCSAKNASMHS